MTRHVAHTLKYIIATSRNTETHDRPLGRHLLKLAEDLDTSVFTEHGDEPSRPTEDDSDIPKHWFCIIILYQHPRSIVVM